ncbi:uncharacterized protein EV420DRAFT_1502138 [Desarmillaria tabescens]|uniref:Bud emergence protein 1 n=1 Tax=Armillaria tabescens TaxID=1929756 RepID=A0AA39TRK2_ARMTA|nr:uncharacterized protein EV420DRAFT_1502138 [Desarmillaria tabescens]KAK0467967.1 hypothetical protein EV420DRAFT_1502138 [Desarmillaria tabescens]
MKSIRKSLNGHKDSVRNHISTPIPLPSVSKPPTSIMPPQKVIKAISPYRPQAPQELAFQKGDFFYVSGDQGSWYEAHNPVTGARGLVPKTMFEEFHKTSSMHSSPPTSAPEAVSPSSTLPAPSKMKPSKTFYAVVLHDFEAERADELDAKQNDNITVVAQSNREWFVAKPIGRLGRPGLIPVSFVRIHDPATGLPVPDVNALMDGGELPKVEDWKRAMFNYKQNSISLGVIDSPNNRESVPNSPFVTHAPPPTNPLPNDPDTYAQGLPPHQQPQPYTDEQPQEPECLPEGILLSADVVSFHYEMDEYWFRIDAIFQPYAPLGEKQLPPAKHLILFRIYNDFYDFQVSLLNSFPQEAGREEPNSRILPFMPGPATSVDDTLTATRRAELDDYLHRLCSLSNDGAKYILEHRVVREFLALKPGDVEQPAEARVGEVEALINNDLSREIEEYGSEVRDTLGQMRIDEYGDKSDGSDYEDEGYAPSPPRQAQEQHSYERHPYGPSNGHRPADETNLRLHAHASESPSTDPVLVLTESHSPQYSQSRWNSTTSHHASASTSSLRNSQAGTGTRSRSHSTTTTPAISHTNPQTAFVKIKIYDQHSEDLIAIRVHPKVTRAELMDKVQTRLGAGVADLQYRDSMTNQFVWLQDDLQLRAWIEGTDKHVLYAG